MFNYRRVWSWRFLKYLEILFLTNSRRFTFDTTIIYYRSKMSQTCCVRKSSKTHSVFIAIQQLIVRRSPQVPMGLHTVGCCGWSFVGTPACGVCGCGGGAAIVTAMGAVAAGTCTVNAELLGFPNEDISHIMGISWAYGRNILSYYNILQHIIRWSQSSACDKTMRTSPWQNCWKCMESNSPILWILRIDW